MRLLLAVIGTVGLGSVIVVLTILARLTQRWEMVTRSRSYYRLFYVASALVALAALARLVRISYLDAAAGSGPAAASPMWHEAQSWVYLVLYYVPFAAGVTISLVLTIKNWGWLLKEKDD